MKRSRLFIGLAGWLCVTFLAPLAGFRAIPDEWYRALAKPAWNPPPWIFGPVWTLLYTLMAVAAWRVWRKGGWREQRGVLSLYLAQLFANALWTPLFFGAHRIGLALGDILLMWALILATLVAFSRVDRPAGVLFVPYLAWVSFASFLNFTLWRMNP